MRDDQFRVVDPATPAAPYLGGKRHLSRRLVGMIEETSHDGYAEAFVGMGGVFLRRSRAPRFEAINDLSGDVATFFRILQRHYPQFLEMLRFQVTSRREYGRLVATDPDTLTDLERSARFLYLQRLAFGGKVSGRNFGVDKHRVRFNITKIQPILESIHERLAGVVIERLDWQEFLRRYDRPGMLFYLDPPYFGNEGDYGRELFSRTQFGLMAERLAALKGQFILSLNDTPEVREIFDRFRIDAVETVYTVSAGAGAKAREVIIRPRFAA